MPSCADVPQAVRDCYPAGAVERLAAKLDHGLSVIQTTSLLGAAKFPARARTIPCSATPNSLLTTQGISLRNGGYPDETRQFQGIGRAKKSKNSLLIPCYQGIQALSVVPFALRRAPISQTR